LQIIHKKYEEGERNEDSHVIRYLYNQQLELFK